MAYCKVCGQPMLTEWPHVHRSAKTSTALPAEWPSDDAPNIWDGPVVDEYATVRRWVRHGVRLGWVNDYGNHTTVTAYDIVRPDGCRVPMAAGDLTGCWFRVRLGSGAWMDTRIAEAEEQFTESTVVGGL